MASKLYSVEVRGREHSWAITTSISEEQVEAMRADGFEVGRLHNVIPERVVAWGLTTPFVFLQDLFNFNFGRGGR